MAVMVSRLLRGRVRLAPAAPGFCAAMLCLASLRADVVHLTNGKTLEGTVTPGAAPGTIEVATGEGTRIILKDAEVLRVEKRASPAEEVETRLKAVAPGEIEPLVELMGQARERGLPTKARLIARSILEIDPHHEAARKELGYVVYQNRWMLEAELKKRKGLVRHRGEWMTEADRARREGEERRKEIEDLLDCLEAGNAHVQEYAVRQLLALREPAARQAFASHLRDRRDAVRWVAIRGLMGFPVAGEGDEEARRIAGELHQALLAEPNEKALEVVFRTLRRFFPRESFRLALESAARSPGAAERQRAARALQQLLVKAWVPELCRALAGPDGQAGEEIRGVLREAFGVDLGQHPDAWLRYWDENQGRFRDE
jgi:hypothetical protein